MIKSHNSKDIELEKLYNFYMENAAYAAIEELAGSRDKSARNDSKKTFRALLKKVLED